jgi:hypothetical protein
MRWRMTAADKMRQMEKQQWHGNGQATMVGGRGVTTVPTTMTTQQSTNVLRQRQRTATAGEWQRINNNGAADKQRRSMEEDDVGCLDRAED